MTTETDGRWLTDSQRVTWTAFAILAMFLTQGCCFLPNLPQKKISLAYSPTSHYRNWNRILTFRVLQLESDFWKLSNNLSGQNLLSAQDFKNDVPTYMEFNQF